MEGGGKRRRTKTENTTPVKSVMETPRVGFLPRLNTSQDIVGTATIARAEPTNQH